MCLKFVSGLRYNFCHSSTRFFVEEVFGRWKNRFRFLLHATDLKHKKYCKLVYVSMILYNMCTIRKDGAVDFEEGSDEEWQMFFKKYARHACPSCVRHGIFHCSHSASNRKNPKVVGAKSSVELRTKIQQALWQELADLGETQNVHNMIAVRQQVRSA